MQQVSLFKMVSPLANVGVRLLNRHGRFSTVAAAVALALALPTQQAWAVALGRASVQSSLGEPLRAEIDVPAITAEESSSLTVNIAPPDAFRAANMEYNAALADLQVTLQKRPDGRTVLRLNTGRAVTEPFLDLVLQANWANGRLTRGYTLLLDPPNARPTQAPVAPVQAAASRAAPPPAVPPVEASPSTTPVAPAVAAVRAPATAVAQPKSVAPPVTVRKGGTAGEIANQYKPAQVSLEQMLVGLLRNNPDAFIGNNVNRIKAGAVVDIPDEQLLSSIDDRQAKRLIAAQSRDFNDFRRRLAAAAGNVTSPADGRVATGKVQTEIKDNKPTDATPDKLTLSKGGVAEKAAAEDKVAKERQAAEAQARAAELARNLEDLNKLKQAATKEPAPVAVVPPTMEAPAAPTVTAPVVAQPAATPPAAPPPAKPAAPASPAPAALAEPTATDMLNEWVNHPFALPAAGGAAALLGVLALLRLRKRRAQTAPLPSSFDETKDANESFFDASGGQSVDTSEETAPSSMMYSLSQLDISGDVDRVAEADVLLAYGRDAEAENVLLDALHTQPERTAIHLKLLEVYALRKDKAHFQSTAKNVFKLTQGQGPDWETARNMGFRLDPDNPLYLNGLANDATWSAAPVPVTEESVDLDLSFGEEPGTAAAPPEPLDADNHLDFEVAEPAPAVELQAQPEEAIEPAAPPQDDHALDFDFDLSEQQAEAPTTAPAAAPNESELANSMDFDLDLGDLESPAEPASPAPAPTPEPFDMSGLSLDLDLPEEPTPADPTAPDDLSDLDVTEGPGGDDPLETKLSLAQEFEAIGDTEGARTLAEEVEAESSGELRERARAFLAQLS